MIDEVRENFNSYGPFKKIEQFDTPDIYNWTNYKNNKEKLSILFDFLSNIDDGYKRLFVVTLFSQVHLDEGFDKFYKFYLIMSGRMKEETNDVRQEIINLVNNIKDGNYDELNDIIKFYKEYSIKRSDLTYIYALKSNYINEYNDVIDKLDQAVKRVEEAQTNGSFKNRMKRRKELKKLKLELVELGKRRDELYNKIIEKDDSFNDEDHKYFVNLINVWSSYKSLDYQIPIDSINYIDIDEAILSGTFFFEEMNNTCIYIQKLFDYHLTDNLYSLLQQIRGEFSNSSIPANGNVLDFRTRDIIPNNVASRLQSYYYKGNDVNAGVEKLNELYKETISIQNEEEYIKGVLKFVNEFILVHPYDDGNGRTSRTILTTMLADRGIFLPTLYDTYINRKDYRDAGDKYYYDHDIEPLYEYTTKRIGEFENIKNKEK